MASLLLHPPPSYFPKTHVARGWPVRQGTRPRSQQASRGPSGWGNAHHAFPDPLVLEGHPVRLSSSSPLLPPSYAPRTHVARWGLGGVEDQAQEPRSPGGSLGPKWVKETLGVLLPDSPIPEGPSVSASPLLPNPSYNPRTNTAGGSPGRQRTWPGTPAGLPGHEWAGETSCISPDPLILEGPSPSASPLLSPTTPLGPTQSEGAPESRGPGLGRGNASCTPPDPPSP